MKKVLSILLAMFAVVFGGVAQSGAGGGNLMAKMADMMKDPQMKEMMRTQQKMMIDQMYGAIPLSATKLQPLKQILLDRQMAALEAALPAMSGGTTKQAETAKASQKVIADYDAKIKALLTAGEYKTFKDYEQTVSERTQVNLFKNTLPANLALSPSKEKQLINAMYEERMKIPALAGLKSGGDLSELTAIGPKIMKMLDDLGKRYAVRAATILSPQQLEHFKQWEAQMTAMQAATFKQMFGNQPADDAAPTAEMTPAPKPEPVPEAPAAPVAVPEPKPAAQTPAPPLERPVAVQPQKPQPAPAAAPVSVVEPDPVLDSLSEPDKTAATEGKKWLTLIDSGAYSDSWHSASDYFQNQLTDAVWGNSLETLRKPMGALVWRRLKVTQQATNLPGVPSGHYVLMQFVSSFSDRKSAIETVTVSLQPDGKWRAAGYFIQ